MWYLRIQWFQCDTYIVHTHCTCSHYPCPSYYLHMSHVWTTQKKSQDIHVNTYFFLLSPLMFPCFSTFLTKFIAWKLRNYFLIPRALWPIPHTTGPYHILLWMEWVPTSYLSKKNHPFLRALELMAQWTLEFSQRKGPCGAPEGLMGSNILREQFIKFISCVEHIC